MKSLTGSAESAVVPSQPPEEWRADRQTFIDRVQARARARSVEQLASAPDPSGEVDHEILHAMTDEEFVDLIEEAEATRTQPQGADGSDRDTSIQDDGDDDEQLATDLRYQEAYLQACREHDVAVSDLADARQAHADAENALAEHVDVDTTAQCTAVADERFDALRKAELGVQRATKRLQQRHDKLLEPRRRGAQRHGADIGAHITQIEDRRATIHRRMFELRAEYDALNRESQQLQSDIRPLIRDQETYALRSDRRLKISLALADPELPPRDVFVTSDQWRKAIEHARRQGLVGTIVLHVNEPAGLVIGLSQDGPLLQLM